MWFTDFPRQRTAPACDDPWCLPDSIDTRRKRLRNSTGSMLPPSSPIGFVVGRASARQGGLKAALQAPDEVFACSMAYI